MKFYFLILNLPYIHMDQNKKTSKITFQTKKIESENFKALNFSLIMFSL